MSNHSYRTVLTGWAGSHGDDRATLRRLVHATSLSLAEMDRLLERAEQLVSREAGTGRLVPSHKGVWTRAQGIAA